MASKAAAMAEGLSALSRFFIDDGTLGDTLLRVAQLACEVSQADMAGITLLADGKPATGASTDPGASDIDRSQYDSGQGPAPDAFRSQQAYRIDSIAAEGRWPDFAEAAAAQGIIAALSLPMAVRGAGIGVLSLYSRTSAFGDAATRQLQTFAGQAAVVLANAQVYWDARELNENMEQAMLTRSAIDQAIGILMADGGRTPDEAFQLLVSASQRENRKLREIAAGIVSRVAERRVSA